MNAAKHNGGEPWKGMRMTRRPEYEDRFGPRVQLDPDHFWFDPDLEPDAYEEPTIRRRLDVAIAMLVFDFDVYAKEFNHPEEGPIQVYDYAKIETGVDEDGPWQKTLYKPVAMYSTEPTQALRALNVLDEQGWDFAIYGWEGIRRVVLSHTALDDITVSAETMNMALSITLAVLRAVRAMRAVEDAVTGDAG